MNPSLPQGVVDRESREHQRASQPSDHERSHEEGFPADRAAGQRRAGRVFKLPTASAAVETVHVPQQQTRQEDNGSILFLSHLR